ncbi:hypothetical protein ROZALSC1DRAFT_30126, partial [Rozella allomycis CSF55]
MENIDIYDQIEFLRSKMSLFRLLLHDDSKERQQGLQKLLEELDSRKEKETKIPELYLLTFARHFYQSFDENIKEKLQEVIKVCCLLV